MKVRQVLLDISTQRDFLEEGGAIPVLNRRDVLNKLARVLRWAREQQVPLVSAIEAHRECELPHGLPRHCIDGSWGQKKLPFTLLENHALIEADNSYTLPEDLLETHGQVIFRKRTRDFLSNPKAERLLTEVCVGEFIICGVGLEYSIKALVLGLIARQKRVAVVADACGYWNRVDADLSLRQIEAKGATLITAEELLSPNGNGKGNGGYFVPHEPRKRRRTARPRMNLVRSPYGR